MGRGWRSEDGVILVEASLYFPLVIFTVFAMIYFGRRWPFWEGGRLLIQGIRSFLPMALLHPVQWIFPGKRILAQI